MSMSTGDAGGEAMCEMNTTPLIDVMLVLLIMFILNIPVQTHATKLDLPIDPNPPPPPLTQPVIHRLEVDFLGQSLWDGQIVDNATLKARLDEVGSQGEGAVQDQVNLRPDQFAKYEPVLKVMAMAQKSHVKNLAFVGNEVYANN
jgi:biopolymer transport protein ExbD